MKKAYTIVMRLGKKFEGKSFCSTLSIAFYRMGHIWSIVLKGLMEDVGTRLGGREKQRYISPQHGDIFMQEKITYDKKV